MYFSQTINIIENGFAAVKITKENTNRLLLLQLNNAESIQFYYEDDEILESLILMSEGKGAIYCLYRPKQNMFNIPSWGSVLKHKFYISFTDSIEQINQTFANKTKIVNFINGIFKLYFTRHFFKLVNHINHADFVMDIGGISDSYDEPNLQVLAKIHISKSTFNNLINGENPFFIIHEIMHHLFYKINSTMPVLSRVGMHTNDNTCQDVLNNAITQVPGIMLKTIIFIEGYSTIFNSTDILQSTLLPYSFNLNNIIYNFNCIVANYILNPDSNKFKFHTSKETLFIESDIKCYNQIELNKKIKTLNKKLLKDTCEKIVLKTYSNSFLDFYYSLIFSEQYNMLIKLKLYPSLSKNEYIKKNHTLVKAQRLVKANILKSILKI